MPPSATDLATRPPAVAGQFYDADPHQLGSEVRPRDRAAGVLLRGLQVAWGSVRYSARRTADGLVGFRPVLRRYVDVRGAGCGSGNTGHGYAHACRCRAHPNTTMVP